MNNNDSPILTAFLNGEELPPDNLDEKAKLMIRYDNKIVDAQSEWSSNYMTWKRDWGKGEWQNEPDIMGWVDEKTGYFCLIRRSEVTGSLCGYVGITNTHRAFKMDMDDCNFTCHGGVTYAGHTAFRDFSSSDDIWWIGFDCAHFRDLSPAMDAVMPDFIEGLEKMQYRNIEFVKESIRDLADDLYNYNNGKN